MFFLNIPARLKNLAREEPITFRYVMDGLLVGSAIHISSNTHNLFAIRLGANDYQLSLVFFLPQILNMLILIPGGLFIDSLKNKRQAMIVALMLCALGYIFSSLSPFVFGFSIVFFLASISLAGGAMALHTISWQSYFPEIVKESSRNRVITLRSSTVVFISMVAPLLVGVVLMLFKTTDGKIVAHQGLFILTVLFFLFSAYNFHKFPQVESAESKKISFIEVKKAVKSLLRNKPFLFFTSVILFFYMTWHMDWTLYFIGQVTYLNMNEFQVGLVVVCGTAVQLLTLKFWSRKNERYGVVLPFVFGILGLSLCPISMIIAVSLPVTIGPHLFLIFHAIANITFPVIVLNHYQCLLKVIGTENKSFTLSVFACIVCLSNAIMPVAGVALYHALGGDLNALRNAFWIVFSLRIAAALLWLFRWRVTREV